MDTNATYQWVSTRKTPLLTHWSYVFLALTYPYTYGYKCYIQYSKQSAQFSIILVPGSSAVTQAGHSVGTVYGGSILTRDNLPPISQPKLNINSLAAERCVGNFSVSEHMLRIKFMSISCGTDLRNAWSHAFCVYNCLNALKFHTRLQKQPKIKCDAILTEPCWLNLVWSPWGEPLI